MAKVPFNRITCSIREACEMVGIGRTNLYKLIKAGKVETVVVGGRRLVLVRSLYQSFDPHLYLILLALLLQGKTDAAAEDSRDIERDGDDLGTDSFGIRAPTPNVN